jgi:hypothetical protein
MAVTPVSATLGSTSGAMIHGTQGVPSGAILAGSGGSTGTVSQIPWDEPTHCLALKGDGTDCHAARAKGTDYCIGHLRSMEKHAK